jgi:hypothetical protein
MARFPTSVSLPGGVSVAAALLLRVFGGFPDFDGGCVDVSSLANGAALAGTLIHGNSVGSNALARRYGRNGIGDTLVLETGSSFAKKSLKSYLVLVPWEVSLPLGQPEGLVFSPSGTFSTGPSSVESSVPRHEPTIHYTDILRRQLGQVSLISPRSAQIPKNGSSRPTNRTSPGASA